MDPTLLPFFGIVGVVGFAAEGEVHFYVDTFSEKAAVADVAGSEEVAGFVDPHTAVVCDQFGYAVFIGTWPAARQAEVEAVLPKAEAELNFADSGAVVADAEAPGAVVIIIFPPGEEPWRMLLSIGKGGDE